MTRAAEDALDPKREDPVLVHLAFSLEGLGAGDHLHHRHQGHLNEQRDEIGDRGGVLGLPR